MSKPKNYGFAAQRSNGGKATARRRKLRADHGIDPKAHQYEMTYTDDELEYLRAVAAWQKLAGVRFPTACDYRAILVGLGYQRASA